MNARALSSSERGEAIALEGEAEEPRARYEGYDFRFPATFVVHDEETVCARFVLYMKGVLVM